MEDKKTFKIILNDDIFIIPTDFQSLSNVNPKIYLKLRSQSQYVVQSQVHKDTLKSFINYWTKKEIPEISINNISEYELLSQEFDLMKCLIKFHLKKSISLLISMNHELKQEKDRKNELKNEKTKIFNQIIQILFNNIQIETFSRFKKVKGELLNAVDRGNTKLVDLLTRREVTINGLSYVLYDKTASLFLDVSATGDVIIPRSIIFNSNEYIITEICEGSFKSSSNINSIQFDVNSMVKLIDNLTFSKSSIKKILIPASVTNIGSFVFSYCKFLKKIDFSENSELNEIEKSAFSNSAIESITIPRSVVKLGECCFYYCKQLKTVTFSKDSLLKKIDEFLFSFSSVEKVVIPPKVEEINRYAFSYCKKLKSIDFMPKSELKMIDEFVFSGSSIESITIPSGVVELRKGWSSKASRLKNVKILQNEIKNISYFDDQYIIEKLNKKSDTFDNLIFARKDIEKAVIPDFIKRIDSYAFNECKLLKKIECSEKSELKTIGEFAFTGAALERIVIPSGVVNFQEGWCCGTSKLTSIEIIQKKKKNIEFFNEKFIVKKSNKNNENFDILIFACRNIETATIPKYIRHIDSYSFNRCKLLKKIEFSEDSELKIIDKFAFSNSGLQKIVVPSGVVQINESAFYDCLQLNFVEFKKSSKLKLIGKCAFTNSSINKIRVPSHVVHIGESAFSSCTHLNSVKFSNKSQLKIISKKAFAGSSIESIFIPQKVDQIGEFAFFDCFNLKVFEIADNSELRSLNINIFDGISEISIFIPVKVSNVLI